MEKQEKNIKISFLVPTLGEREQELKRLLESLKAQGFSLIEAIIIAQGNYKKVREMAESYADSFDVIILESNEKGLSKARNRGLSVCSGEIVVLSDDDCWYADDAVAFILAEFEGTDTDILFTQIKDYEKDILYKKYAPEAEIISSKFKLLSRSSIEIAFRREKVNLKFDERFGLGARFVAGEENDFLLNAYKLGAKMKYVPKITVYHPKKERGGSAKANEARGAFYAKHFNFVVAVMICFRDLILRKQNIFKDFYRGYHEYRKGNN